MNTNPTHPNDEQAARGLGNVARNPGVDAELRQILDNRLTHTLDLRLEEDIPALAVDIAEWHLKALKEAEQAYGGCTKCYGKAYFTKRVGTSSRHGNVTHDTIGFCTCERGKQLEKQFKAAELKARIDELEMAIATEGISLVAGVPIKSLEGNESTIDPGMLRARLTALKDQEAA